MGLAKTTHDVPPPQEVPSDLARLAVRITVVSQKILKRLEERRGKDGGTEQRDSPVQHGG